MLFENVKHRRAQTYTYTYIHERETQPRVDWILVNLAQNIGVRHKTFKYIPIYTVVNTSTKMVDKVITRYKYLRV